MQQSSSSSSSSWREEAERELARLKVERASRAGRRWSDWLPPEHRSPELEWPTEVLGNAFAQGKPTPNFEPWSADQISAFVDDFVRSRKDEDEKSPPKKRQKNDGASAEAAAAFGELWKMDFGDGWANPFRTRLSREACAALGMADYYDRVPEPVDLSLVRERLRLRYYPDDRSLRRDLALIPHNARLYHPPDSPIIPFADRLLQTFDDKALLVPTSSVPGGGRR